MPSCNDLEEKPFSIVTSDNFYKTEEEIISSVAPAYGLLRNHGNWTWILESLTTDEMCLPTRGLGEWYDGGIYQRYHEHTWTSETDGIRQLWSTSYSWVNQSNMLVLQLENLEGIDPQLKSSFISELKLIRAFGYYNLLNFFGNVPIIERFDVEPGYRPPNNSNFQAGQKQVFEFVENDIIDNIEKLNPANDRSTYGRFNKWAAMSLAVKLYMNAKVWTGVERWDEAIQYANQIIESGEYSLEPNYFANFLVQNSGSKENIFVIPFDDPQAGNMNSMMYHRNHHFVGTQYLGAPVSGWNGQCATPWHYKSFNPDDVRREGWLVGLMRHHSTGDVVYCTMESAGLPLEYTVDFVNIYDPDDNTVYDYTNAKEYHGPRFLKYEFKFNTYMGNDLAIIRYADILLLKAEALMWKNGGLATPEAVQLVNQVRSRAFKNPSTHLYTTETLTMDELLAERAREFYYEGVRRNDLIRFGKFVKGTWPWYNRSNEEDYRNVYPIPQREINVNPNLKQNPGY